MDGAGFTTELRDRALTITLDRPQRRNALTVQLVSGLADRVTATRAEDVRVIVLRGGPPVFCAGGDLADLGAVAEQGPIAVTDVVYRHFHRLVTALATASV